MKVFFLTPRLSVLDAIFICTAGQLSGILGVWIYLLLIPLAFFSTYLEGKYLK